MILTNKKNSNFTFFLLKIFVGDMEVLFSKTSCSEHGTLNQLRNSIHRSNVVKQPIDSYDATHDFFTLVVEAYILVAAMKVFEMDSLECVPSEKLVPEGANSWMIEDNERQRLSDSLVNQLLKTFFAGELHNPSAVDNNSDDKVLLYSKYLLTFGCFYLEYCDAVREGDGSRVLQCWRYMLPIFISSGRKNYAVESMHLLMQHDYLLSPREAGELVWSRFVNVHGCPGQNIPNDLHMEHLNRVCKNAMKGLGANKTPQSISRISNALGTIIPVLDNFDDNNAVTVSSDITIQKMLPRT